ncbi:MAG: hypothetical protein F6K65_05540 [Moorea sp. SIO3C2]|nr:hypothetical protein [Moorena sp. SIO3C2]
MALRTGFVKLGLSQLAKPSTIKLPKADKENKPGKNKKLTLFPSGKMSWLKWVALTQKLSGKTLELTGWFGGFSVMIAIWNSTLFS